MRMTEKFIGAAVSLFLLSSCTPPETREYQRGQQEQKAGHFKEALAAYEKVVLRSPESAVALMASREGAKIAFFDLKDFKKALEFNQRLVVSSPDPEERQSAQEQVASIYFDELADYPNAVKAINRLLMLSLPVEKKNQFRMKLAKAYYFQNNFVQAESESSDLLRSEKEDKEVLFQMMVLKANVYLAKKDIGKATDLLKDVMKKYPEKSVKENVATSLAVAFEEVKDYRSAIAVLEAMRPYHSNPEYIDLRIKKLQEAVKNQPGAHGLRHK
jgi:tetratricopeptide (TPR) repeat protein